MTSGYRWLFVGALGAALAVPTAVLAAQPQIEGVPGGTEGPAPRTTAPTQQPGFQPPPTIRPGQPLSVLVFPFGFAGEGAAPAEPAAGTAPAEPAGAPGTDTGAAGAPAGALALSREQQEVSNLVTATVKGGLLSTPYYSVTTYNEKSPLILRALKDDIVKMDQHVRGLTLGTGAIDMEKATMLAYRLGIQSVLVGEIELTPNAMTNSVEVTVQTRLVNSETGQVLRQAASAGAATGAAGVAMIEVRDRAARDAAMQILPGLGIQLVPRTDVVEEEVDRSRGRTRRGPARAEAPQSAAEKATRKAADDAEKAAREAARAAEKAREEEGSPSSGRRRRTKTRDDVEKEMQDNRRSRQEIEKFRNGGVNPSVPGTSGDEEDSHPTQTAQAAQPAQPGAAQVIPARPVVVAPTTYQGVASGTGEPIPYGYAMADGKKVSAGPRKSRNLLRIPPWLGLIGFVSGVGFLLK